MIVGKGDSVSVKRSGFHFVFLGKEEEKPLFLLLKKMSEQQLPAVEEENQGDFTGRVFNHCTFNASVTFTGNVFVESYGYRNIGDVLRLQEQRLHQLQQQSTTASTTPPLATTVAPPAPSRSVSAPLFTGSPMPPPSIPAVSSQLAQSSVLSTPQATAGKGKGTQKKKQSPVEEPKEMTQSKRKEVESAIGPSSEKPHGRRLRNQSDEADPNYIPGETQIP